MEHFRFQPLPTPRVIHEQNPTFLAFSSYVSIPFLPFHIGYVLHYLGGRSVTYERQMGPFPRRKWLGSLGEIPSSNTLERVPSALGTAAWQW